MLDLFESSSKPINRLPKDGEVYYYGPIMSAGEAGSLLGALMETVAWQHDQVLVYGKTIVTKRKTAWYGDEPYHYTYSGRTKVALPWTSTLLRLKGLVEQTSGERFNCCLLNLYHNGSEGMSWHSDNEKTLQRDGAIASLSFGVQRKFSLKHQQSKETVSLFLQSGSLLVMAGCTQRYWKHQVPLMKNVCGPRINLTFRNFVQPQRTHWVPSAKPSEAVKPIFKPK